MKSITRLKFIYFRPTVAENEAVNGAVQTVRADDNDGTVANNEVTYAITGKGRLIIRFIISVY